ncbi:hypothetical protein A3K73_07095 [Candidatus Pacearchaeota archaeon RBG_13_36_9]|nr:MAG: hypothetical protein A3K73_07095 [Candidatus Pacearchaeota archaeon RBG_13_36_9]
MKIKRILAFIAVIIIVVNLAYYYPRLTGKGAYEPETVNMARAIDGDTFETKAGDVRLLCINTPERNKPFYTEAKIKLAELDGKEVQILRDRDDQDQYNRKLRFVFYKNRFINKELLEEGLANLYMCQGLRYEVDLKKAEEQAREQGKGIWKKSTSKCADCLKLVKLEPVLEYFILKNRCDFGCEADAKDEGNHFFAIELAGGEEKVFESRGNVWNDGGDRFFLRDDDGLLLYYSY